MLLAWRTATLLARSSADWLAPSLLVSKHDRRSATGGSSVPARWRPATL